MKGSLMKIGLAADHGGFKLKEVEKLHLRAQGFDIIDFGAKQLNNDDDYSDFVIPLARAIAKEEVVRGIAVCGSGVGASVAANKVPGVRAAGAPKCFCTQVCDQLSVVDIIFDNH